LSSKKPKKKCYRCETDESVNWVSKERSKHKGYTVFIEKYWCDRHKPNNAEKILREPQQSLVGFVYGQDVQADLRGGLIAPAKRK
jgi:hypothetical protein